MGQFKVCKSTISRQKDDDGSGRIFVPSDFGGGSRPADNCEAAAGRCPNGYTVLGGINRRKGTVNDTVRLSASDLRNYDCWHGGHYSGIGSQAILGLGSFHHSSHEGGLGKKDNYGRPCFKKDWAWFRSNPVNGNKNPGGEDTRNYHMDACCGFVENVKRSVKEKYCHPKYCHESPGEWDKITKECQDRLSEKCKNWSFVPNSLGFEDPRCANAISQLANSVKRKISDLDETDRKDINKITASITSKEYADNGKRLCKVTDFLNNKSTDKVKKGKFEKCTDWCKNNENECSSIIKEVCKKVYDRTEQLPELFPDNIKEYESICACNWPQPFYDKILKFYKDTYPNIPSINPKRKCLFKPCDAAHIPYVGDTPGTCPTDTFVSCTQNLTLDFRGSDIQGTVNLDAKQNQSCGSAADAGVTKPGAQAGSDGGSDSGGGGESDGGGSGGGGGDDNTMFIILGFIFLFILMGGFGIFLVKK